jgi:hypothetical protein
VRHIKKLIILAPLFLVFAVVVSAQGVKNAVSGQSGQGQQAPLVSPTNQPMNQNQVKTQNQGEEQQLQVSTQEQESLGISSKATQSMSVVAETVQELLEVRTQGGIGDQVREIARAQNQSQERIQQQINKLRSRSRLQRFLVGADLEAVKVLQEQLDQNQSMIDELTALQGKLASTADKTAVEAAISALTEENTALQETITAQRQTRSMFGWLVRLFGK